MDSLVIRCRMLIITENGSRILSTVKKSYPSCKKIGVPIISNPTPKIDWKMESSVIIIISKVSILIIFVSYYTIYG